MDIISFEAQYEIQSSLEVMHDFLDHCPMHLIDFNHVLVYNVHGKIKVRMCPYHGIHQWLYCWFVCNVVHCNNFFSYLSSKNFISLTCGSRGVPIGLQPSILEDFNIFQCTSFGSWWLYYPISHKLYSKTKVHVKGRNS